MRAHLLLPSLLTVVACQVVEPPAPEAVPTTRARGIYIPVKPEATKSAFADTETRWALGQPLPIYLHRHGGTYTGGYDDSSQNRSSVVGSGSATVSAFNGGDGVWNAMKACVEDQFARFNAYVTDVEPTSGEYIEAVVGGSPGQVGLPQGVGGVAPIDPYQCNIIASAIVYVFSSALPNDPQVLCEVAAQEIAHALSLDHELLCEDPMTYLSGCGDKSFQDQAAQCGEYSARSCDCGRPSQNSVQILYEKLGTNDGSGAPPPPEPDSIPPTVSIATPSNGAVLPPNSTIEVSATASDDKGVASVELLWEYTGDVFPCPVVAQGYSCESSGSTYTWRLNVGSGARTFQVRARDVGGNIVETPSHTISLDTDGGATPPPVVDDTEAPEVSIVSPADGAVLLPDSVIEVVGVATDDVEVTSMELVWDYTNNSFPCPTDQEAVSCTRQGSTYRWQINVGSGTRSYRMRASDAAGHVTTTATQSLTLSADAPMPVADDDYEDNDTWDEATTLPCSSGLDLYAAPGDVDWLVVAVAPGVEVSAQVRSLDGVALTATIASGPRSEDVLGTQQSTSAAEITAIAATTYLGIRVEATGGAGGDYRVVASCNEVADPTNPPTTPPPGGGDEPPAPGGSAVGDDVNGRPIEVGVPRQGMCSSTSLFAPEHALLALALLLVRRRVAKRAAVAKKAERS